MDERIWPGIMPPAVAAWVQREFETRGVRFHHRTRVTAFEGKEALELVCTNAGDFEADLVVVGAGIQLNTELAALAGLAVDGGILVDEYLQTSVPGVFAAGDVASFPDPLLGRRHLEHWDNAVAQGRVAGANMAGQRIPFRHVPYFWSDLFDLTINVVGALDGAERMLLRGTLESRRFTLLALRGGALRGALMVNRARDRRPLTELIRRQTPVAEWGDKLADPSFDPATIAG
jgi:3-phenylpropionate/trans-cinnamate dioxygenase ferredoxin reductase component